MDKLNSMKNIHKITLPTPFPVGDVNVYLLIDDKITLVDAGVKTEEAWTLLKGGLKELGFKITDIDQVVLTHHHPDHVGLLDFLPEDIPVFGHAWNEPWISREPDFFRRHDEFFRELFVQFGIDPVFSRALSQLTGTMEYSCTRSLSGMISEGDTMPGLPGWRVYETPGHAQSHILLHRPEDGAAIGGDLLLSAISPNPLIEPPLSGGSERPRPLVQYLSSLKKLDGLHVSRLFTGHGDDIIDVRGHIAMRLRKQEERAFLVREMLKEGPMPAFEVCRRLFPSVYKRQLVLTISETVGQLDFLESLGEIAVDCSAGTYTYHAT